MYVIAGPLCSSIHHALEARVGRRGRPGRAPGRRRVARELAGAEAGAVDQEIGAVAGIVAVVVELAQGVGFNDPTCVEEALAEPRQVARGLDDEAREEDTRGEAGRELIRGRGAVRGQGGAPGRGGGAVDAEELEGLAGEDARVGQRGELAEVAVALAGPWGDATLRRDSVGVPEGGGDAGGEVGVGTPP
jgi:hypothetical protein